MMKMTQQKRSRKGFSFCFTVCAINTSSVIEIERRTCTMAWKIIKEIFKTIFIVLLLGFFTWFFRSIYRTIRYGIYSESDGIGT